MIDTFRSMVHVTDRARSLQRAMPLLSAFRIALGRTPGEHLRVRLKAIDRDVFIRPATSDLTCLEKVFIHDEYRSPFPLDPRLIVDAGANVGMATMYFAHCYPHSKVVAIEPEARNFAMLERNCAGLPNVTLIHAALWPDKRPLMIEDPTSEAWTMAVTDRGLDAAPSVPAVTVEDVLERVGLERIDLLKLDIEGSELQLFSAGAERWIDRVGMIAIELHDRYRAGCAQAFYSVLTTRRFAQEMRGENIFVKILGPRPDR